MSIVLTGIIMFIVGFAIGGLDSNHPFDERGSGRM